MKHRIVFVISPGGEMTSTVEGIEGAACGDATSWVDDLGEILAHERTPDYYRQQQQQRARESVSVGTGSKTGGNQGGGNHGSPW